MRRALPLLLAVAMAACGGGAGGIAATVNGVQITVAEVQAMRTTESGTVDKTLFARDLTDAIIDRAVINAARDEFSISPTTAEVDTKVTELTQQIEAAQGVPVEEFFASQNLPIERLRAIANQQVVRDKLFEHFEPEAVPATDADATLLLTSDRLGRTNACVRHILVASEQEALDAKERIDGGEDFATVAIEVSTDGSAPSGGDLGCEALGLYVAPFAEAAASARVNAVTGPVETEFGWHLILVESREEPSITQLKEEINAGRVNQLIDAWLIETVTDATVTVDSQFGTWVTSPSPMVQAPAS